jgi:CheY-like chemotaxis protein
MLAAHAAGSPAVNRPRRVLVIDDAPDTAASLAYLLDDMGHQVEYVTDPRKATEVAQRLKPEIVFLDLGMPHIDGYTLAPMLRQTLSEPDICIVAVTGYGQPEDRERARKAGIDAHILKPMDIPLLESILKTMLREEG